MASLAFLNFTRQHKKLVWLGILAVAVLLTVGMVVRKGAEETHYVTA